MLRFLKLLKPCINKQTVILPQLDPTKSSHVDTGVPEIPKTAGGGVVRLQPPVLPPGSGRLSALLLVLFTLDVLRVRLDPVALRVAAGVHG